ncbi:uncharacterized protein LOC112452177 [Temnothorax curvispinosus]|uniref:Uncharacterized protein LOC112452177 n=1 Tax=Temnothorax curvispinosus TaxID=300111 RepID=A0A6J1PFK4_9HYME|nr:uncharacterized protein LOC112452177 [Temnothorax curvispinosus]
MVFFSRHVQENSMKEKTPYYLLFLLFVVGESQVKSKSHAVKLTTNGNQDSLRIAECSEHVRFHHVTPHPPTPSLKSAWRHSKSYSISRATDNTRKLGKSNVTQGILEARIKTLDSSWEKFQAQHEILCTRFFAELSKTEYFTTDLYETTENAYVMQRGTLTDWATSLTQTERSGNAATASAREATPHNLLPRINLPQFSGAIEDWISFRDLFLSVINRHHTITDVEKLHYLQTSLQDEAAKLVRDIPLIHGNFERAWVTLREFYKNQRVLVRSNFAAFTALAKMKSESAIKLRRIFHGMTNTVNAQESLGRPIATHGMDLFVHIVVELFDPQTRRDWETTIRTSSKPPEYDTFRTFIIEKMRSLEALSPVTSKGESKTSQAKASGTRSAKSNHAKTTSGSGSCVVCKNSHYLMGCSEFRAKTPSERKSIVESKNLCSNCLGNHPIAKCPSTKTCIICNAKHHSLLHDGTSKPAVAEASTLTAVQHGDDRKAILLATARLSITDRHGNQQPVRALIDQGSEVSLISEALAQRLKLQRSKSTFAIFGIGGTRSGQARGKVTLQLTSKMTGATVTAVAVVLPHLSLYHGTGLRQIDAWPHLLNLQLADPQFSATDPVELLLGAEVCSVILEEGLRKGDPEAPIAQHTAFSWIISGGATAASLHGASSCHAAIDQELTSLVQKFWEQEAETKPVAALTPAEQQCKEHFVRTHLRLPSGRYIVRLPWATPPADLHETRQAALHLLRSMERKSAKDPRFGKLYQAFLKKYEDLEHMTVAAAPQQGEQVVYLPHHGVLKEASTTTKLRVVFNGSQRVSTGETLNSFLHVGANLVPPLADVLLRWRRHLFAMIADIEKMYRQVLVHPDDRDYQRIVWRPTPTSEVLDYRTNTVTYGMASSPFLAIRSIKQLAKDEQVRYPEGAETLEEDCYVDDVVTGASTLRGAIVLQTQLRALCGFPLRKWAANNEDVLDGIPLAHRLHQTSHDWDLESHSTLGLRWFTGTDSFAFQIKSRVVPTFTKQTALAETARLFDPLGWLAPVVVRAKILMQSAWMQRLEWDTPLPPADARVWQELIAELPILEAVRIPRWIGVGTCDIRFELHGFADASERGFSAVVYLRVTNASDDTQVHLLAAKTRVAPLKQVSLPRLELSAAALLTDTAHHVQDTLKLPASETHLWSDPTVTLHWIRGHSSRWKTYVANRVSHIQRRLPEARWHHVPGSENPADCASRGISPRKLLDHPLWWSGPGWLKLPKSSWPSKPNEDFDEDTGEQRASCSTAIVEANEPELLRRFSGLQRLLRVTAWCLRWRRPQKTSLTPEEVTRAIHVWLRTVQHCHYGTEITTLKATQPVHHRSRLARLNPFLDVHGILRVGGRLKHSILPFDERHPTIIPPTSWLTRLIVDSCHRRTLHGGVQLTLGTVRQQYWIPQGRAVVKQLLHRCVTVLGGGRPLHSRQWAIYPGPESRRRDRFSALG